MLISNFIERLGAVTSVQDRARTYVQEQRNRKTAVTRAELVRQTALHQQVFKTMVSRKKAKEAASSANSASSSSSAASNNQSSQNDRFNRRQDKFKRNTHLVSSISNLNDKVELISEALNVINKKDSYSIRAGDKSKVENNSNNVGNSMTTSSNTQSLTLGNKSNRPLPSYVQEEMNNGCKFCHKKGHTRFKCPIYAKHHIQALEEVGSLSE
jgi:hypothetical protein